MTKKDAVALSKKLHSWISIVEIKGEWYAFGIAGPARYAYSSETEYRLIELACHRGWCFVK